MWIKRILHSFAYIIGVTMIASTWLSEHLPFYEQVFRTGVVLYLSMIYIEFVDGTLLDRLKPSRIFEETTRKSEKDEVDILIQASRMTLYWIRLVQISETELEREFNQKRLDDHLDFIKGLELPKKYRKDQREIIEEANGFIQELNRKASNTTQVE